MFGFFGGRHLEQTSHVVVDVANISIVAGALQITQQVDEQTEGPPLTLTAVSGQSISLTTDMLKVSCFRKPQYLYDTAPSIAGYQKPHCCSMASVCVNTHVEGRQLCIIAIMLGMVSAECSCVRSGRRVWQAAASINVLQPACSTSVAWSSIVLPVADDRL